MWNKKYLHNVNTLLYDYNKLLQLRLEFAHINSDSKTVPLFIYIYIINRNDRSRMQIYDCTATDDGQTKICIRENVYRVENRYLNHALYYVLY